MERERLTYLLEEPARVTREDIAGLKELTGRYPWFSAAHLLLAMGEHAGGELGFAETLRTTAAHLPSRIMLFDVVNQPAMSPAIHVEDTPLEKRSEVASGPVLARIEVPAPAVA